MSNQAECTWVNTFTTVSHCDLVKHSKYTFLKKGLTLLVKKIDTLPTPKKKKRKKERIISHHSVEVAHKPRHDPTNTVNVFKASFLINTSFPFTDKNHDRPVDSEDRKSELLWPVSKGWSGYPAQLHCAWLFALLVTKLELFHYMADIQIHTYVSLVREIIRFLQLPWIRSIGKSQRCWLLHREFKFVDGIYAFHLSHVINTKAGLTTFSEFSTNRLNCTFLSLSDTWESRYLVQPL